MFAVEEASGFSYATLLDTTQPDNPSERLWRERMTEDEIA